MNNLPDFVTDEEEMPRPRSPLAHVTGWETVVFELDDDDLQLWESELSTAALAP